MPRDYSITDARNQLPGLIHAIESGPAVRLTRRGKPVAVLVSIEEFERLRPPRPDLWRAIEAFRRQADLTGLHLYDAFREVRDPSPGRDLER